VKSELEAAYRGNANGSLRRNVDAAIMDMIASAESALDHAAPFPHMPRDLARGSPELQVPFKFVTR